MAAKNGKKADGKTRKGTAGNEPPFGPGEYLSLDNKPATKIMPKDLASEIESRRVSIRVPEKGFDLRKAATSSKDSRDWEIALPNGSTLTRPGRDYGRMSPAEVAKGIKGKTSARKMSDPYQPPWLNYEPHAKVTAQSRPLMHRVDGRLYEPHFGVFGTDNREVYYPSGYPWSCVGRIFVWPDFSQPFPAWSGSGVLIGPRVVLTAGHLAPWGSGNWAMQFVPAYYDGGSTLGASVDSFVSDYWGYDTGNQVSAWDMLVLRLYTPLGTTYGYFGTKDYSSSWEGGNYWTLAGYPGAIAGANRPSRQMWWPVLDDDSDGSAEEVEYEADATDGNSGGPVFGFWSGLPYAIATHSGGSKTTFLWWTLEDTNVGAGGGALNSLVAWARSNWP